MQVTKLNEEFFLPGEVILEQGSAVDQIYIVSHGRLPYTVRVCELCRLLRMEKQSLTSILQLFFTDGQQILNNLLNGKETDVRRKQLESDITYLIAKQESELALGVNSAAYHGDLGVNSAVLL